MVSGKISAPLFELENEKIIRRHINAVALSAFLKEYPEYYDGDNRSNFLNSGGYTLLKEYLSDKPDYLQKLLVDSIPQSNIYGINDWSWIDFFTGQEGILETAVNDYYNTIRDLEKERERTRRAGNDEDAARIRRKLREYRADKEKDKLSNGRPPASRSLIDFLVRNNVLPKYGFPVDTVSLYPDAYAQNSNNNLQMQRDLQYAVAEYAPGSEIVADGRIYTSRYIKRSSNRSKGMWEYAYHTICQNKDCKAENYLDLVDGKDVIKCGSCGHEIARRLLKETIEPRKGFIAEEESHPVRMSKPDRNYRTDEFYIGDPSRRVIDKQRYSIHDQIIRVESTANDSLVVRTQTKFKVCRLCGFATGHNEKYQLEHKTAYGKKCSNDKPAKEYFLTHEFKTDVARITFETSQAIDYSTMISALFALLEAMSKELDIERNDIKGTLYKTRIQGIGLVYNIIIYDAVGGGAGHSRRLITSDGQVLSNVIKHAVDLLESCDCDPSCYKCLRNYFNQKLHDFLDRRIAASFLKKYIGPIQALEEEESEALISVNIKDKNPLKQDYESWDQASILLAQHPGLVVTFINLNIPVADFFDVTFQIDQARHSCLLLWETSKTMLVTNMDDEIKSQLAFDDWKVFSINDTDFHDLKKQFPDKHILIVNLSF